MDSSDVCPAKNAAASRVLERLAAREASRKAEISKHRDLQRDQALENDAAANFLRQWRGRESLVALDLEALENQTSDCKDAIDSEVPRLSSTVADLDQELASAAFYLPSHDLSQLSAAAKTLKQRIEVLKAIAPKKRFSFSRKAGQAAKAQPAEAQRPPVVAPPDAASAAISRVTIADGRGLEGLRNETKVMSAEELAGGDFTLHDLQSCQIYLLGPLSALRMHRLRDCKVYTGPVAGASFVDDVENCILMLASQQFRIHSAKATAVYLRVRSNPIIEQCSGLQFAPYTFEYPGCREHLCAVGLGEDTGLWAEVNDFDWLRNTPSPNWSILEPSEREEAELAEQISG